MQHRRTRRARQMQSGRRASHRTTTRGATARTRATPVATARAARALPEHVLVLVPTDHVEIITIRVVHLTYLTSYRVSMTSSDPDVVGCFAALAPPAVRAKS